MSLRLSFAAVLQMLRKRKGLSQYSIATRLDQTTVSKLETATRSVTLDVSYKLAAALGVEATTLVALTAASYDQRTPREILLASLAEIEALELADTTLPKVPGSKDAANVLSAREKWQAVQALKEEGFTQGKAAKQLGMPESTLRRLWHQVSKD
ncbi:MULTISPECIES: helix-turn-helix domain-containing protein [Pseudomonas syringae group]|uniref:HTH cro/C1-type domain-containing protein n=1 Tax=Pseudomonas amygdali pv. tabaci TaxID=322 RepID=A0A3M6GSI1_PSEAJ|nr:MULTISPECIES: helix-turn-helix transcriptional regulator [Pseudomonas syringae group]MEE4085919.1 helix-turn-helix transcriptional regulator [Pseudomonas viridiflava]MEE4665844.1 helix-turn-helix transcriptional regulator [Pseudomonas alliivorans]MEE4944131.1 helix-turn-helix transcriptional regulator [Pseudomonas alliivorans]RMV95682.1 hypothetical protein ALP03_200134 [Pseudomonas amygdali pv. tabaci]